MNPEYRIVGNKDGYLIIDVGGGAHMTCPTGQLEWRLRYGDAPALVAASAIDSFEYLIMHCTQKEAWRRIKLMRAAMLHAEEDKAASTKEALR